MHSHEFHELVMILSGRGRHVTAEGEYEITAGEVFMIRGALAHGYKQSDRMHLVNILFDPRLLRLPMFYLDDLPGYHAFFLVEPKLRRHAQFRHSLRLPPAELAEAAAIVARLEHELSRKPAGYRFMACAHFMQLVAFLARGYFRTAANDGEGWSLQKVSEVLSYIDSRYRERITVAMLAKVAGMSESTLTRTFHKVMGRPPLDHVIRVRIGRARELLRRRGARVTETAFACGFNDGNYFSRQFRKVTGMGPRVYQRQFAEAHAKPLVQ